MSDNTLQSDQAGLCEPCARNAPGTPRKSKGGAPVGNRNRQRSGVAAFAKTGQLPRGCSNIAKQVNVIREMLEIAVQQRHGQISVYHALLIQSCLRHEARAGMLTRWLRLVCKDGETPENLTERLAVARELSASTDSRDRCLKLLQIDSIPDAEDGEAMWAEFDKRRKAEAKRLARQARTIEPDATATTASEWEDADGGQAHASPSPPLAPTVDPDAAAGNPVAMVGSSQVDPSPAMAESAAVSLELALTYDAAFLADL